MKHKKWWCHLLYNSYCARCQIKYVLYGHRGEEFNKTELRASFIHNPKFTTEEALWIIKNTGLGVK